MAGSSGIRDLNFKVILKDDDFNKKIKADLDAAKKFNAELSDLLTAKEKAKKTGIVSKSDINDLKAAAKSIQDMLSALKKMPKAAKDVADATAKAASKAKEHTAATKETNKTIQQSTELMKTLSAVTGLTFGPLLIRRFLSSLIEVSGNLELQRESLSHILGSYEKGSVIFQQLRELSKPSYFTLPDLTKYAKQLAALSIPYEELFETTKMLGDVSAGLGVSFDRIALAYGHIRSMGFLRGMQARQLTNAGIPIFEELAKNLSEVEGRLVSINDVYDRMGKRQITFEQVRDVFKQMTEEGGKFNDMQIAMTETLAGRVNKLKGVWEIALSDIGNASSGVLKGSINALIWIVDHLSTIAKFLTPVIVGFGAYAAALATVAVAQKAVAAWQLALSLINIARGATTAAEAMQALGIKTKAALVGSYIGIALALAAALYEVYKYVSKTTSEMDKLKNSARDLQTQIGIEKKAIKELFDAYEKAEVGTKKYDDIKTEILRKYGDYLSNVDKEKIAVGDLAGVYDRLAASVENARRNEFLNSLDDKEREATNSLIEKYRSAILFGSSTSEEVKNMILGYIMGAISKEQLPEDIPSYVDMNAFKGFGVAASLEELRNRYARDLAEITAAYQAVRDATYKSSGSVGPEPLQDFQEKVNEMLKKSGNYKNTTEKNLARLFGFGDEKDWHEYRKKVAKAYKELLDDYEGEYREDERRRYRDEIRFAKDLNNLFGGHLLSETKSKAEKKEESEEERRLKADIAALRKYKEIYDSLLETVGKDYAQFLMRQTFKGVNFGNFDFLAQLQPLVAQLAALDATAAQSIYTSLGVGDGKDILQGLKQAQQTAGSYRELIRSLTAEDTNIEGTGFWYKINKVASDLETKLNKIAVSGAKAREKLAGISTDNDSRAAVMKYLTDSGLSQAEADAFWRDFVINGENAIDTLIRQLSEKARNAAKNTVDGLAKDFVTEMLKSKGMDVSNLASKSFQQIHKLRKELQSLVETIGGKAGFDDHQKWLLEYAGFNVDSGTFEPTVRSAEDVIHTLAEHNVTLTETQEAYLKLAFAVQKSGFSMTSFAEHLKSLIKGMELDKEELKKFAKEVKDFINTLDPLLDKLGQLTDIDLKGYLNDLADVLGSSSIEEGAVKLAVKLVGYWLDAAIAAQQYAEALSSGKFKAAMTNFSSHLSDGVDGVFGENTLRKYQNAIDNLEKLRQRTLGYKNAAATRIFDTNGGGLIDMAELFDDSLLLLDGTLLEMAQKLKMDLYDSYGNLNAKTLQAILDTYTSLDKADKEWIEGAIAYSEAYAEALKQVDEVMSSVVGDLASDVTSRTIDQWGLMRDGAIDYSEALENVAAKYAEVYLKSMLLKEVFNDEFTGKLRKAMFEDQDWGETERIISEGFYVANRLMENVAPILEPILKAADKGGDSTDTLKSGISKELVEQNSSLIASYINSIRADVAVQRQDIHTYLPAISKDLRLILTGSVAPSLSQYQAEVQARLANLEESNALIAHTHTEMLRRIESVIGLSSSGGSAVRVMK